MTIQRAVRDWLIRRRDVIRTRAAIAIQSAWRNHVMKRNVIRLIRQSQMARRTSAAVVIQVSRLSPDFASSKYELDHLFLNCLKFSENSMMSKSTYERLYWLLSKEKWSISFVSKYSFFVLCRGLVLKQEYSKICITRTAKDQKKCSIYRNFALDNVF